MSRQILIMGATGMLGQPVTRELVAAGHQVRVLTRNPEKTCRIFGKEVEIEEGDAVNPEHVREAMAGCDAVHLNLVQGSELRAMQHVIMNAQGNHLERITFVSATTACEENRWFDMIDSKMRTEALLRQSGIAYTIFCPTWVMETLNNFVQDGRVTVILGRNPPALHFFAAADFGQIVAASYEDRRALGKRLFIHGPDGITLPAALRRFASVCHPDHKVRQLKLWQAQLIAKLTSRASLNYVTRLIGYFDQVGELGDPAEANALFDAPSITLDEWFKLPKLDLIGVPH